MNTSTVLGDMLNIKKSNLLSIYGETGVVSEPIVKSEETAAVEEETEVDKTNLEKSEKFAILESIATGEDIVKSAEGSEKLDPVAEKEESEKTAPNLDKEGEGKEGDEEKEPEIKKSEEDVENVIEKSDLEQHIENQQARILSLYQ